MASMWGGGRGGWVSRKNVWESRYIVSREKFM